MNHDLPSFQVILATRNQGKTREISDLFSETGIQFKSVADIPGAPDVVEDGKTLEENARKKAFEIARHTGQVSLADDSGLEVEFLDGAPGVISARFAGEGCSYEDNNRKLLHLLRNVPTMHRRARFRCVLALAVPGGATLTVEGSLEGYITETLRGQNGFGYDPVFLVPEQNKTLAEMTPEEKNGISHRGRAIQAMKPILVKLRDGIQTPKRLRPLGAPTDII